jgi:CheY-like chemotaxis protein
MQVGVRSDDAHRDAAAPVELKGISVLVVDDNATNRRIFEKTLEKWQMLPTLVENGADALTAVRAAQQRGEPFRLVLLDANMPEMDGFSVAQHLTQDAHVAAPTIMMLTSSGEPEDAGRCKALGISTYLIKPVRQAALCEAILETLGRTGTREVPAAVASKARPTAALRILLAEDNIVNQRVATGVLEKAGHAITVAENGQIALELLAKQRFDLVLMDMQMPEMGGAEAIVVIRTDERATGAHMPIISLTAHALKGDRERCIEAGADGYVSKPLSPAALFGEIDRVLARPTTTTAAPRSHSMPAGIGNDLLARVGGSEAMLQEVIELFLEDCPKLMNNLREALAAGDADAVYYSAHTLKGSAGNFDAIAVVGLAQRLEARAREGSIDAGRAVFALLEVEIASMMSALAGAGEHLRHAS